MSHSDIPHHLLKVIPTALDVSKLGLLDAHSLADIARLSNAQLPNTIHRYPTDSSTARQNEKLEKLQREIDEDIAQVRPGVVGLVVL